MSGEDVQDRRVAGERARARSGTARRLLLLATSLVVAAVGLELGFRGVQSLRGRPYDAKDTRLRLLRLRDVEQADLIAPELADMESEDGRALSEKVLHPFLAFEPRGKTLQLEGQLKKLSGPSEEATYDVVVLGGSVAGQFAKHGRERLVELLAADPRFAGRRVRFAAWSSGGYKQPQQTIRLLELLHLGYQPDLVLEIDGYNELALGMANVARGTNPYLPSIAHWLNLVQPSLGDPRVLEAAVAIRELRDAQRSGADRALSWRFDRSAVLGRWTLRRLARLRTEEVRLSQRYAELLEEGADPLVRGGPAFDAADALGAIARTWEQASRSMRDLCVPRGIRYLHVLQPALHDEGSKPLTARELDHARTSPPMRDGVRLGYPLLREGGRRLRAAGVEFLDASDLFADDDKTRYFDPCHFDPVGCQRLAERIAAALLRESPAVAAEGR